MVGKLNEIRPYKYLMNNRVKYNQVGKFPGALNRVREDIGKSRNVIEKSGNVKYGSWERYAVFKAKSVEKK